VRRRPSAEPISRAYALNGAVREDSGASNGAVRIRPLLSSHEKIVAGLRIARRRARDWRQPEGRQMKIILASIAFTALAGCAATAKEEAVKWRTLDGKQPLVIAHRGASGYLPEHTLEAYALAIDQGADVIEPDLVFTQDGVLVARHDRYLSTTTNISDKPEFAARKRANNDRADIEHQGRVDWWVEDFTLAELKTLRARQSFPGRPKDHDDKFAIPTFDELLTLVAHKSKEAGRAVGVYPETKHPAFFASIGHDFERPLLAALQGFDAGPVFVQSFEPEILKRLKGKTNAKLVQLVYEKEPGAGPNISLDEIAKYADGVGAAKAIALSGAYVTEAHRRGLFVHPWTFRDDVGAGIADELGAAFAIGADGAFADFPDSAVKVRASADRREQ
jgi:glycerophosphoryl diester phosphodiesterase